ncbi:hypothetical protein PENANT_c010G07779 [Penicillium antarcticum]|uniref:Uncharacterized protein n=1 Tax=Penicillium antarcticum TaxID=416450 RepID=A0A1V6Q7V7_9EURO|nr:uncharacterized protein N7508_000712 [Penicillium antarcticum]KAJ5320429.1 hypothetical protein N7508_000712 [Penicillium antarcticum]OQD85311.1 hypothetical protein PENANT_c010G07779 [Penicillium antarcticum]
MARLSVSLLTVLCVLAALALSMPVKRDEQAPSHGFTLESTLDQLKSATKLMDGLDNKDSNDKENQTEHAPAESDSDNEAPAKEQKKEASPPIDDSSSDESKSEDKPTSTKKLSSGTFVTPTATNTHHPTSVPNALGKLPLVGGLLGGAGGGL